MPELLDEIRGVADGAEIDYDTILSSLHNSFPKLLPGSL
jgi:hypothetical protein